MEYVAKSRELPRSIEAMGIYADQQMQEIDARRQEDVNGFEDVFCSFGRFSSVKIRKIAEWKSSLELISLNNFNIF